MKLIRFFFFIHLLSCLSSQAQTNQNKIYFDRLGKTTSESQAYYYRTQTDKPHEYISYYVNGGSVYFEGTIQTPSNTDENLNVYSGTCTWYYKNNKKKSLRTFSSTGLENGTSIYYFESGKIWKEVEYKNGAVVGNSFKEYDEEGKQSRTFEENFSNNSNDWDLYTSDKTSATIGNKNFVLTSFTNAGAARYISIPTSSEDFVIDVTINISKLKSNDKAGLIYGFKDWQNYNFFLISGSSFYVGFVYEGVLVMKANGMFSSDIRKTESNVIKILGIGEKNIYSINGAIQYTSDKSKNYGSNIGFSVSGQNSVTIENLILKEIEYKGSTGTLETNADLNVKATGSGIFISTNGYILTNYHVVENANKIQIEVNENGVPKTYNATIVQKDMDNDLAILQINDEAFKPFSSIDYSFVESGSTDVGAGVFTIGFPFALSGMGKGAKFTDGKISSKTGYNGAINSYQTSIPVQPGNSGGPVFNESGQLIGVINAKIIAADNVSYAIKLNYIKNLIELLPNNPAFPNNKRVLSLSMEEKIKVITPYVVLIKIK